MKVHVHTDRNLMIDAELESRIAKSAGRRSGLHVRCRAEAHPSGLPPVIVTHDAADAKGALDGAVDDLVSALGQTLSRVVDKSRRQATHRP
jgi:hypothetical protein